MLLVKLDSLLTTDVINGRIETVERKLMAEFGVNICRAASV